MPQPRNRKPAKPKADELPPMIVKIDGKERTLRFTFHALGRAEEVLSSQGETVNLIIGPIGMLNASKMAVLIWAGLLADDATLDTSDPIEEIGQLSRRVDADSDFFALSTAIVRNLFPRFFAVADAIQADAEQPEQPESPSE